MPTMQQFCTNSHVEFDRLTISTNQIKTFYHPYCELGISPQLLQNIYKELSLKKIEA